jgi:hypothetical protein
VLGALAEAPTYLIADRLLLDQFLTYLTAAFASHNLSGLQRGAEGLTFRTSRCQP